MFYVYELVVVPDGTVCYVGKGSKRRMYAHKAAVRKGVATQSRLYRKLRELIALGKDFEPRKVFEHEDQAACIAEEERRIALYGLGTLFNVYSSNPGPLRFTAEVRAAQSRARVERVEKCLRDNGCTTPISTRQKMSKSHKARWAASPMSQETRDKISAANRGRKLPGVMEEVWKKRRARVQTDGLTEKEQVARRNLLHLREDQCIKIRAQKEKSKVLKACSTRSKWGFKGVAWRPSKNYWEARFCVKHLGSYRTKEEAAQSYDNAYETRHGFRPNSTPAGIPALSCQLKGAASPVYKSHRFSIQ